ncbi:GNAT family N-acetyltransferase [Planococcus kocurii]|uniref:GNAT family N-acetyltransferase n=1 Tax=Planococcus kocurii TaxID=1374 RepID=UPI003D091780
MNDIYFNKEYGRLYEKIEKGECQEFVFEHTLGKIQHLFIKCEIPQKLTGQVFYDLVTPYGYGGPRIVSGENSNKVALVSAFEEEFGKYCANHHIVSESVRFHPVIKNHVDFESCYELNFRRQTIQTRLAGIDDPILTEYSASCRRDIRHGLKAGVTYRIIEHPENLEDFKKLYYSTMQRNAAKMIYYFNDEYFQQCLDRLSDYLVVVEVTYGEQIIGMSLNFVGDSFIHVHLTGTCQKFHQLAPAYILQYALALWGKEQGKELIHHGGGRTKEVDDKLYLFKKKFGRRSELTYFIGRKIWNRAVYEQLCYMNNASTGSDQFPAYRSSGSSVPVY